MAITRKTPTIVHLGGEVQIVNDLVASESITPGHLIHRHDSSGFKWRKHNSAGGAGNAYALDQSEMNKGLSDLYASGDLVKAAVAEPGATFYALLPSGQNITQGALLESNGNGTLKVLASGVAIAVALESVNTTAQTGARIRIESL